MATLLLATAPDNASAANYTARFNRAITLGPKSKVYVKSASMTLGQSYAIQTGSNDTLQFATGPTNDLVTATVASGEYTGRDALTSAVTAAINNAATIETLQDPASAGTYVETCCSASVTTNTTNVLVSILGPQVMTNFPPAGATPDDTFVTRGCALSSTGANLTRNQAGQSWRQFAYVNPPQSRGSGIFMFSIDTKAPKKTRILGGFAVQRSAEMDPSKAAVAVLVEVDKYPLVYVDGILVASNGPGGAKICGQGHYFRIIRMQGRVTIQRANGLPVVPAPGVLSPWQTVHTLPDRAMINMHAFVSLFEENTKANNLRFTPDITAPFTTDYDPADETEEEAAANAILGAIDPTTPKRIVCGSIGALLGFKISQEYDSAATATGIISSDQVQATTGVFPSVQIRCPSLPVETWDSASGQVQNIIANIDKQSLLQDPTGLQQLYIEYAPTPLKCYFREPTAISSVQIIITDNDGNIITGLTGRTTVMLAFVE